MEIISHIRDLLYHHDCVVVPGFGGFVTNDSPARVDKVTNSFYPPSRDVGFNVRLDHNDGLLISYLSSRLKLNYVDVRKLVDAFARDVNRKLESGETVIFDGIGLFMVDKDKNLQFDPYPSANFLTDSYGLSFFRYPQVTSVKPALSIQKRLGGSETFLAGGRGKKLLRYAAVGIPLIVALSWGAMNFSLIREFNFNLSSLNPFSAVVDSGFKKAPPADAAPAAVDAAVQQAINEVSAEAEPLLHEGVTDQADIEVSDIEPVPESPQPALYSRTHHLVAGSFRDRENALTLTKQLEMEGFQCEIMESEKGMYRVSLFSSNNSGETLGMLRQLRTQKNMSDIWMLTR